MSGLGIASAQSGATTNVKIIETEFKLDPATITVPANTPIQVTVTNAGTIEHNLQFGLPAQNIEKKLFDHNLKPGETRTATFTFTATGNWEMDCPVDDMRVPA
jgi:plastocyanin